MSQGCSRRYFLSCALGALAAPALAGAPAKSLRPQLRPSGVAQQRTAPGAKALIDAARLGGTVSFSVIDPKSGRELEGHEAAAGQPPASVSKAVTALYALDTLGLGFRFDTRLLGTGAVQNGVLKGDLILAGGGDPVLDTDALGGLAAGLKAAGVREVRGRFRVWGGALPFARVIDTSQPEEVGYNPSVSGIALNHNRVHFEWKRAGGKYAVTMDARSAKYRPEVRVSRMAVAKREMPVYTYADKGDHDAWTVASAALGNGGTRWLPVRKPEAYTSEVFVTLARAYGIVLKPGDAPRGAPSGQVLASHKSPPLQSILRDMLKYSNNLTAELVGMTATARRRGRPASIKASAEEMSRWARDTLGMTDCRLVDHSGLGEASRLSARSMARALAQVHKSGRLKPILKDIPMRDEAGKVNPSHPVKVVAKTGTLYFVSSLAGYMTGPDGTELAFAIFAANPKLRQGIDRTSGQRPEGSRGWNGRAKRLQQALIERWGVMYGS